MPNQPEFIQALHASCPEIERALCLGEQQWAVFVEKQAAHRLVELLIREQDARFCNRFATDEHPETSGLRLWTLVFLPAAKAYLAIVSDLADAHPAFLSLSLAVPAANWAEREVRDMFGATPVGHPDPRRLVMFEDWPEGRYPLLKEFDRFSDPPRLNRPFDTTRVEGEGVFEVLVGPVHAGIIEPGHFRFSVDGEQVLNLEAKLFWKHRGLEKRAEGCTVQEGLFIAERICGACSFANALAYCQAIEAMSGCVVPPRAELIRVLAAELERLYNHAGDFGGVLLDVAYSAGAAHAMRLREDLLQLNDWVAGHRLLMGLVVPGGVRRDLSPAVRTMLGKRLKEIGRDFADLVAIALHNESVLDRFDATGTLDAAVARDLAVVGPAARAAGLEIDARRDAPYAAYGRLRFEVITGERGDVLSRVQVKTGEFTESLRLIDQVLELLTDGPIARDPAAIAEGKFALGHAESARGENLHFVRMGADGRLDRYHVRTSSYMAWPAVPAAVLGNIVPDFPVINKSFNLCYACTDR